MPDVKELPLKSLRIDHRYQRPIDQRRVDRMVENFDERRVGVLEVSRRDGQESHTVIDGQHRLEAMRIVNRKSAMCLIHTGLSAQEEAELFVALQLERKNLRPWERFVASVFAGDKKAKAIDKVVRRHGFRIGSAHRGTQVVEEKWIEAVVSLERLYRWGGARLVDDTFALVNLAWEGDPGITNGYFLQGVGLLLVEYGHRLAKANVEKLAQVAPTVILRRGLGYATYGGGTMAARAITTELRRAAGLRGRPRKSEKGKYEPLEWLALVK